MLILWKIHYIIQMCVFRVIKLIKSKSSTIIDKNTKFKIYQVKDASQLSESYYNDTNSSNLVDVTNNFNGWITYNSDNSVNIQFGHIDGAYIIEVEGKYDSKSGQNVKTRVSETNDTVSGVKTVLLG